MASYNPQPSENAKPSEDSTGGPSNTARAIDSPIDQGDKPPKLVLHLNAKQRKQAESAAESLERAQARLSMYWENLSHLSAEETESLGPDLAEGRRAICEFNSIAHPGEPARSRFIKAEREFEWMSRLLKGTFEIKLERLERARLERDDLTESERAATLASLQARRDATKPGAISAAEIVLAEK